MRGLWAFSLLYPSAGRLTRLLRRWTILWRRRKTIKDSDGRINDKARRCSENSRLSLQSDPLCIFSSSSGKRLHRQSFPDSGSFTSSHETRHRNLNREHIILQGRPVKISVDICVSQCFLLGLLPEDAQRQPHHTVKQLNVSLLFVKKDVLVVLLEHLHRAEIHSVLLCYLGLEPAGLSLQRRRWWAALCLAWNLPLCQPQGTLLGVLLN